jgi:uncharacterized protein (DUF2062 family)
MLFRRREPADFWDRMRTLLWPRRSFARSFQYFVKRVIRLSGSPHAIAAGVASGVFASCTPFVGFHFIIACAIAYLIAGNMIAAALGTAIGNPLTFPFIWGGTLELGRFIVNGAFSHKAPPLALGHMLAHLDFATLWSPILKPMLIGSVPIGLTLALGAYFLTRSATVAFRNRRRQRLAERARKRAGYQPGVPAGP